MENFKEEDKMDFEDLGSRPRSKHASPRHVAPGFLLLSLLFNTFEDLW